MLSSSISNLINDIHYLGSCPYELRGGLIFLYYHEHALFLPFQITTQFWFVYFFMGKIVYDDGGLGCV